MNLNTKSAVKIKLKKDPEVNSCNGERLLSMVLAFISLYLSLTKFMDAALFFEIPAGRIIEVGV